MYSQCLMFLENVRFIYMKKCHHILDMLPDFLVLAKELICAIKVL